MFQEICGLQQCHPKLFGRPRGHVEAPPGVHCNSHQVTQTPTGLETKGDEGWIHHLLRIFGVSCVQSFVWIIFRSSSFKRFLRVLTAFWWEYGVATLNISILKCLDKPQSQWTSVPLGCKCASKDKRLCARPGHQLWRMFLQAQKHSKRKQPIYKLIGYIARIPKSDPFSFSQTFRALLTGARLLCERLQELSCRASENSSSCEANLFEGKHGAFKQVPIEQSGTLIMQVIFKYFLKNKWYLYCFRSL